jgi:hypothetical protein
MIMSEPIQWPRGEFTVQEAVNLNPAWPQTAVRKQLSAAIAAKTIVQTRKGDGKIQGAFQLVKVAGGN